MCSYILSDLSGALSLDLLLFLYELALVGGQSKYRNKSIGFVCIYTHPEGDLGGLLSSLVLLQTVRCTQERRVLNKWRKMCQRFFYAKITKQPQKRKTESIMTLCDAVTKILLYGHRSVHSRQYSTHTLPFFALSRLQGFQ